MLFAEVGTMAVVLGVAFACIVVGIFMAWGSKQIGGGILPLVVYWVGVALIVVGLVLLLTPVLIYINNELRKMLAL